MLQIGYTNLSKLKEFNFMTNVWLRKLATKTKQKNSTK